MSSQTPSPYQDLIQRFQEIHHLNSISELLAWDQEVMMPSGGAAQRAEQASALEKTIHAQATDPKIGDLLESLEADSQLDTTQQADVREARRTYDKKTKIPSKLVEELARLSVMAVPAWAEARKNNDFQKFAPFLEQFIARKREYADAIRGEKSRYDALLDEFEPNGSAEELKSLFSSLRERLLPFLQKLMDAPNPPNPSLLEGNFTVEAQRNFSLEILKQMGYNTDEGRLDISTHPFCSGTGGDVRITTRYQTTNFLESLFGCMHEGGHALYEQGLDRERISYPAGGFASLGIHESQSRLWENIVGRSVPFWNFAYPKLQDAFPQPFQSLPFDDFWRAINHVTPSLIRTESDEVTYNLHIILRFDIEIALLEGDLPVSELPAHWNQRFQQDFGITPPNDAKGCLQDIHWASGLFAYFPTYTLGNLYASQFFAKAKQDLPQLDAQLQRGELLPLREWLRQHIHKPGRIQFAQQLCQSVTQQPLSIDPFFEYIEAKYAAVYNL